HLPKPALATGWNSADSWNSVRRPTVRHLTLFRPTQIRQLRPTLHPTVTGNPTFLPEKTGWCRTSRTVGQGRAAPFPALKGSQETLVRKRECRTPMRAMTDHTESVIVGSGQHEPIPRSTPGDRNPLGCVR